MKKGNESEREKRLIHEIQRDISIVTAALLVTGQLTIRGVFVSPQSFGLSLAGPLTGTQRLEGRNKNKTATTLLDVLDILIALLLLKGSIALIGIFIGSRAFTLVISGPIFGTPIPEPSLPDLQEDYNLYKKAMTKQFDFEQ